MTTIEEKALLGTQEDIVNRLISVQADIQATRELVILLANKTLVFADRHDAASVWQELFAKAKTELEQQSKAAILKKMTS
jgi:hypothetical protein